MKVDVITVEQASFKRWRWWSNWIDVAVFDYECTPYLLQMRVSRLNKKNFNALRMTGRIFYRQATCAAIGDLMQMSKPQ